VEITEVRIKLMEEPGERLQAFCSITFDDSFVVRDLKIIEGSNGPFVAMPSRKLTAHCPSCGMKNHLRAGYCNHCGTRLREQQAAKDEDGRAKLYADIAHPINSACRELIQNKVIEAFIQERERARQPGYVPQAYDEYDEVETPYGAPAVQPANGHAPSPAPADGSDGESRSLVEPAQIHGAERPRGPRTVVRYHAPAAARDDGDSFGAGIFE
jgi:stage V sporulation protein G